MSLADLAGTTYGPVSMKISAAKVAEYVDVTGDDADRWIEHAPPSYAGALLFVMAPRFLWASDVRPYTKVLVHSDQRFEWHTPIPVGERVDVSAVVARVRARGPMHFVTFAASVSAYGKPMIDSESTFLMAAEGEARDVADEGEPAVGFSAPSKRVGRIEHAGPGSNLPSLSKSASRADLVRYAGASGDFNPVHYDHDTALEAGFGGVIVHGLLMGAWMAQLAAATASRPDPLQELKLRFKNALRPGISASVSGVVGDRQNAGTSVALAVAADGAPLATGRAIVREG